MSPIRILIINPNSNASMTEGLRPGIESLGYNSTTYKYHTAPSPSPPSINDLATASASSKTTLPTVLPLLDTHDAFLVACYSPHPLVSALKEHTRKPVLGIFEASVSTSLALLGNDEKFGIVSTGEAWKEILGTSLREDVLRAEKMEAVFAGVETLGLDAGDLHGGEHGEDVVKRKVMEATRRLIGNSSEGGGKEKGKVSVVVLGCAGMAGMEEWVREEVEKKGEKVRVVDGVKAGVGILQGLVRGS